MRILLLCLTIQAGMDAQETDPRAWRTISLPRQALSLVMPSAWKPRQGPSHALLVSAPPVNFEILGPLGKEQAERIWKATCDGMASWGRGVLRSGEWARPGSSGSRLAAASKPGRWAACGLLLRTHGSCHVVVASVAADQSPRVHDLRRVLDSIDARPFEEADRFVDWRLGCSLRVPAGWTVRSIEADTPHAALRKMGFDGGLVLEERARASFVAVRRLDAKAADRPAGEVTSLLDAKGSAGGVRTHSLPMTLEDGTAGTWREATIGAEGGRVLALSLTTDGFEIVARVGRSGSFAEEAVRRAMKSFRGRPWAGARKEESGRRGFDARRAPAVTFISPADWTAEKPRSSMRLLQLRPADARVARCVAWFFGAGGGGGVNVNFERWQGQIQGDAHPRKETHDIVEGVRAHMLDTRGTWIAETRPGSGEREHRAGWRLVGAVLEAPGGPLYIKLFGPLDEVRRALPSFRAFIASFRPATKR